MRLLCAILPVFLCLGELYSSPTYYPRFGHHHRPLARQVLDKMRSISSWLDGQPDATVFDYIYHVNKGAGLNMYQGDIDGFNIHRTATTDRRKLWNTRVVPYVIDHVFDSHEQQDIQAAMDDYKQKTCVRFIPRTNEKDYIRLAKIDGCYSKIGRVGGVQNVSLVSSCLIKGTVIHELMHVLGFFHEQSRPDRDSWVQIIRENILPGTEKNFDKLDRRLVDTLGVEYDYGSVLHYSKYAFSRSGNPTILPTRMTLATLGQRNGFSYLDLQRINILYRCDIPGPLAPSNSSSTASPSTTMHPTTARPALSHTKPPPTLYPIPTIHPTLPPKTPPDTVKPAITLPLTTVHPDRPAVSIPVTPSTGPAVVSPGWSQWSVWSFCNLQCTRTRYRFCFSNYRSQCPGSTEESRPCTSGCNVVWPLGCWRNNMTAPAIPSVEGQYPTLTGPYRSREGSVRKCANVASESENVVFAIFDNGMCLTGPDALKTFHMHGPSTTCSYTGKGSPTAMNVYTFQQDTDGEWGPWTDWTQCTKMCNGGKTYRYRHCNSPPPVGLGAPCRGNAHEWQPCNTQLCPVDTKCGVKYHTGRPGTSGIISVGHYDNFMNCEYEIMTGESDLTISVSITRIDLEYTLSCISDALMIFDGPNSNSTFLGAHCGTIPPAAVLSSSNKMYLKFQTDETTTGTGFTVLYTINQNIRKSCIQPRRPGHGRLIGGSNFAGDAIHFECDATYALIGSSSVVCIDQPTFAVWSDTFPICMRSIKRSTDRQKATLCSFEESICGYKQHSTDDFDWSVAPADLGRFPQRPKEDHSRGRDGIGHFLIAETSRLNHLADKAIIQTRTIDPTTENQCLTFWTRAFGWDNTYLDVYLQSQIVNQYLIRVAVDTEGTWIEYSVTFTSKESYQIVFEYAVGDGFGSSVALDDVLIQPGECML